jgi:hypothetical protein
MSNAVEIPKIIFSKSKELGDFQTPSSLTDTICSLIESFNFNPSILIEPSCGKGNFIISALKKFPTIKTVIAIELQESYKEEFFRNINNSEIDTSNINIIFKTDSFFNINFDELFKKHKIDKLNHSFLILGNPPWVTNSYLGLLSSHNIPKKNNTKTQFKGLDALTGKSNFDIAETFIVELHEFFNKKNSIIALICKTATIQNIIKNKALKNSDYDLTSFLFDSKKEFGISASANVIIMKKKKNQAKTETSCSVYMLYNQDEQLYSYGYKFDYFVSNIEVYKQKCNLEGKFEYEWRQGLKHDAGSVLVLKKITSRTYKSKISNLIELEDDLVYPFLKSSDIKDPFIRNSRYYILLPQQKLGENPTEKLKNFPKTLNYLQSNLFYFTKRKSRIYNNQQQFSIFGIGNYSFKPYKIVVSGFYKTLRFSLVIPQENKQVMIDDTCYSLSFDNFTEAVFIWIILNSKLVTEFFHSIVFLENKRPFKKEILQRLELKKALQIVSEEEMFTNYNKLPQKLITQNFEEILAFKNMFG